MQMRLHVLRNELCNHFLLLLVQARHNVQTSTSSILQLDQDCNYSHAVSASACAHRHKTKHHRAVLIDGGCVPQERCGVQLVAPRNIPPMIGQATPHDPVPVAVEVEGMLKGLRVVDDDVDNSALWHRLNKEAQVLKSMERRGAVSV